ncbi:MAG TPA: TonB-dependent receptor [Methylophaga sp.]|jgi:TonB-dependent receptor|uniref:TonB-dependent receptor n=1 Tax=unclassified Methylophaga TaxID=2629249 RepID=UPI000C986FEA|nr:MULTISPECIES: TonB-dependent receptor [unclassified Methylophaga]MAP25855.1 TonB-dependent receptor [Methylophaga sp.]HAD32460.1 TonB-dependent receptor [Methylophaga sp.]|tara:strand:- start:2577 stop:5078 length:2502 start_codon:yes stop_codon:yes gene_type:complete
MKLTVETRERPTHKLSLIALSIASVFSNGAFAADEINMEKVQVFGQAVQIDKALNEQRNSNSIESVVHADGIGQLPDDNAAEALQRLPGVSVENDQGEGRFVTVRGLAPELNAVTINGTNIPSPEDGTRAVALDVLPSELIQSLSVVKTLTPDMDANSLGGTVNVRSLSAFDHDGLFYTLSAEGSYDDNTDQTSPKGSGAFSNIFSIGEGVDNFGVAAALSWQKRDFGSDNVETGGAWDFDGSPRLGELEQRDYDITRERLGLGVNFDYKADIHTNYYLRTLFSQFTDTETRNAAGMEFADPLLPNESGDGAEGFREVKDRKETQEIQSYVFGGEKTIDLWTINGQVGYSRASEDSPGHIAGAKFVGDFDGVGYGSTSKPTLNAGADYYDPNSFELDSVEWEEQKTTDTEKNIKFDLARDFDLKGYASQIKFGGKLSRREKDNDLEAWEFEDFGSNDTSLAAYSAGNVDYSLNQFGNGISSSAVEALLNKLNKADNVNEEESRINDYVMNEDINSAYVMNTLDLDEWTIIAGLRYEGTRFKAKGTGIRDDEFETISSKNSYNHWLPGLHGTYYLDDKTQIRAAWTNSVVRPTFEALAPGFSIESGDSASFGNPDLDPMTSKNLDLGIEHYMGRAGAVSAYVFYKDISDFVYNTDVSGTGLFADFDEAVTFANGDSAEVYGIELAYSQKLSWLPAPWNGLLVGANATFSQSDAEIEGLGQTRSIDLPGQSKQVGNLMIGWENDKLSMRLSTNYKSSYLSEVAAIDDEALDQYVDSQVFLDFGASYFLTKNAQISLEVKNITDESFYVYNRSSSYNAQYEEYGPTIKLGFTLTNF